MIDLTNIHFRYSRTKALNSINLNIGAGECVALVGPTGAGKSTLLKLMAGQISPTQGFGRVAGYNLKTESATLRKRVGWLPSQEYYWPSITGYMVFKTAAQLRGHSKSELDQKISHWNQWFNVSDFMHQPIHELSKGQVRKIGVCRWLLSDHPLSVLDDPTEGLDPVDRVRLSDCIRHNLGTRTIVIASHELEWLTPLVQRVIVLDHGSIKADDTLANIQKGAPDYLCTTLILKAPMEKEEVDEVKILIRALPQVERVEHDRESLKFMIFSKPSQDVYPALRELLLSTDWPIEKFTQSVGSLNYLYRDQKGDNV